MNINKKNLHSADGIATSCGLDEGAGDRVPVGLRTFTFPSRRDLFLDPSSLLSNGCQGYFPMGKDGRGMRLTTHLKVVPK